MEFEINEPFNPNPWEVEWRRKVTLPGRSIDHDDMCVMAMEIPESEEL